MVTGNVTDLPNEIQQISRQNVLLSTENNSSIDCSSMTIDSKHKILVSKKLLFGGAITCDLPVRFQDVSNFRQVRCNDK
jgi:hypothetical protein